MDGGNLHGDDRILALPRTELRLATAIIATGRYAQ
jgi:hypothetical protein